MDQLHRFLLESLDIRGVFVRLGPCWQEMQAGRSYAPVTARLLGEMTAVTAIIAGQLKSPGRLTFQMKGNASHSALIERLVIDCDESLRLRGMACAAPRVPELPASALLGDGQLVMTLDIPELVQPFQSHVPLKGECVADIFEHYLELSEQQATRLLLAADEDHAVGMFLQKLPGADQKDADGWDRVKHLLATVSTQELLGLDVETLLLRVFHQEDVRLFDPRTVSYHCPEDWPKINAMLRSLGAEELQAILDEYGEILVKDDICNREYRLGPEEVARLIDGRPGHTLH